MFFSCPVTWWNTWNPQPPNQASLLMHVQEGAGNTLRLTCFLLSGAREAARDLSRLVSLIESESSALRSVIDTKHVQISITDPQNWTKDVQVWCAANAKQKLHFLNPSKLFFFTNTAPADSWDYSIIVSVKIPETDRHRGSDDPQLTVTAHFSVFMTPALFTPQPRGSQDEIETHTSRPSHTFYTENHAKHIIYYHQ